MLACLLTYFYMYRFYRSCLLNQVTDETEITQNSLTGHMTCREMYNCYLNAKENRKIGYMKRLKNYWDKLRLEFNFLKNLRDQTSRMHKNKVVIETEYKTLQQVPAEMSINEDNCLENKNIESNIDFIIKPTIIPLESQEMLLEILRPTN